MNSTNSQDRGDKPRGTHVLDCFLNGLRLLALLVCLLLATEPQAQAYTDPGTGALIWQMLVAGFVGALFYVRRFTSWFKVRKKETKD